jgi:hypothetical protein
MGQRQALHLEICDRIEELVRFLSGHFRSAREWSATNPLYSEECAEAPSFRSSSF